MSRPRLRRILAIVHRVWVGLGLIALVVFTTWALLAYRASAEAHAAMIPDDVVTVTERESCWIFRPAAGVGRGAAGLVFFPGAAVDPRAYAPVARAVAEHGHPVVLVQVPRRGMFGGAEGTVPLGRARAGMRDVPSSGWVVAGHSRGAEIAARMLLQDSANLRGLVLIGSSHPRDFSIAHLRVPVVRIYATRDTVADVEKLEATRGNLPGSARSVRIEGGNHSQFGSYGFQPGDWPATIAREDQQAITVDAVLDALRAASRGA